jgi:hypothetical protein
MLYRRLQFIIYVQVLDACFCDRMKLNGFTISVDSLTRSLVRIESDIMMHTILASNLNRV